MKELTAFMAMKYAILNCRYFHQVKNTACLFEHSFFTGEDKGLLVTLFIEKIDKVSTIATYHDAEELKSLLKTK